MKKLTLLIPGAVMLLGFWGTLSDAWKLNEIGVSAIWMTAISIVAASLFLLFDHEKNRHRVILVAGIGLLLLAALAGAGVLKPQLGAWMNQISNAAFLKDGIFRYSYKAGNTGVLAGILFAILLGMGCGIFLRAANSLVLLAAVLGSAFLMISGIITPGIWPALFLAGLMISFCWKEGNSLVTSLTAGVITAGLAALAVLFTFLTGSTGLTAQGTEKIQQQLHKMKYESETQALPEGQLGELNAFTPSDQETLAVTMEHWDSLYIKGFTGETYTGSGWERLSTESLEKEKDLLHVLQKDYFYDSTQTGSLWEHASYAKDEKLTGETNHVKIETIGACKAYSYLPYGAGRSSAEELLVPEEIQTHGCAEGKYTGFEGDIYPQDQSYLLLEQLAFGQADNVEDYMNAEAAYSAWVHDTCLEIPENVYQLLAENGLSGSSGVSTTQAKSEILAALSRLMEYKETVSTYPGDGDFIASVLDDSPEGYSVHYATLAAMMLRTYGIPSRYCEGYLVSKTQAAEVEDGETKNLTQRNAHAWVEYYLQGIGWQVFDPTPGHEKEIDYILPEGEGVADATPGNKNLLFPDTLEKQEEEDDNNQQINTQTEDTTSVPPITAGELLLLLVIGLIMLLILLLVHYFVEKHAIKKEMDFFKNGETRKASAFMILYMNYLDKMTGRNRSDETERIEKRIWFSDHAITEEERRAVRKELFESEQEWREKTSAPARFWKRYILCRVH